MGLQEAWCGLIPEWETSLHLVQFGNLRGSGFAWLDLRGKAQEWEFHFDTRGFLW